MKTFFSPGKQRLSGWMAAWILAIFLLATTAGFADEPGQPGLPPGTEVTSPDPLLNNEDPSKRFGVDLHKESVMNTPSRLIDNRDGTVVDPREGLMWTQSDSLQTSKKWLNWFMAQDYVKDLNEGRFAGYDDWRLPTRKELETLYDETKSVPWAYYWNVHNVHIDPVFGNTSCCFWSSESYKDEYAWGFNYIRGKTYPSMKGGPQLSLSAIRPVRTWKKNDPAGGSAQAGVNAR
ncbi:MAG: DUF1566 domain-containing protein [Nitrospinae bacterium]|nr:DUF1566 domain-containing protein [Nitrospinota bacterium]